MKRSKKWIQEQARNIARGIVNDYARQYVENDLYEESQDIQDKVCFEMSCLKIKSTNE